VGPLVNYGYENTVLLPIPVKVASDFKAPASGMVEVHLSASWLICRVECIPESGEFTLQIPVVGSTAANSEDFLKARAQQPVALSGNGQASVQPADAKIADDRIHLRVAGLPAAIKGKTLELYPKMPTPSSMPPNLARTGKQRWDGDVWVGENMPLSDMRGETRPQLAVVWPCRRLSALPRWTKALSLAQRAGRAGPLERPLAAFLRPWPQRWNQQDPCQTSGSAASRASGRPCWAV
jgi:thiol:disulfide interchange protein DsbD